MKYTPKHLERWFERVNYEGKNFDDFYVAAWRFFRCSPVERSNFNYIKEHLSDCGAQDGHVLFPVFTDDVMSLRYYALVHAECEKGLKMADMLVARAKLKGSLDPEGEHEVDQGSVARQWALSSVKARVGCCQEAGVSVFAARRDEFPHGLQFSDRLLDIYSEL